MRQTMRVVLGFLAVVLVMFFPVDTVLFSENSLGESPGGKFDLSIAPDFQNKNEWYCEDVTANAEESRCGIVHVCQNRRDANVMALQISLSWNRMLVYRIWGSAGETHQILRMPESTVWTPPLPGGKMECGVARDEVTQYIGILFMIYHEDDPDHWAAQAFFPIESSPASAASARPLRRTSY